VVGGIRNRRVTRNKRGEVARPPRVHHRSALRYNAYAFMRNVISANGASLQETREE